MRILFTCCACILFAHASADTPIITDQVTQQDLSELKEAMKPVAYTPWIAGGAVVLSALITVFFNYRTTRFNTRLHGKFNTTPHFREKWISDLRDTYSEFSAAFQNVCYNLRANKNYAAELPRKKAWNLYQHKLVKIKLLLHHSDEKHLEFWRDLNTYVAECVKHYNPDDPDSEARRKNEAALERKRSKLEIGLWKIIHDEWLRIKELE